MVTDAGPGAGTSMKWECGDSTGLNKGAAKYALALAVFVLEWTGNSGLRLEQFLAPELPVPQSCRTDVGLASVSAR
jgi:uncharacterized protein YfaT (DUF1175 family)